MSGFNKFLLLLALPLLHAANLTGQTPIPLAASSFNWDAVAENTPASSTSTAPGMDLSAWTFYAQGYPGNPGGGFPNSGSMTIGGRTYTFRPYNQNNAARVTAGGSVTLTLQTAAQLSVLNFLVTSTEQVSPTNFTVHFTDGTSQVLSTASIPDWILGGGGTSIGQRVSNASGVFSGGIQAKVFEIGGGISLANQTKFVTSVTATHTGSGNPRFYVFAVSGACAAPQFTQCPGNLSAACPGPISYTASAPGSTLGYSFSGATSGSGSGTGSGSSFNYGVTNVSIIANNGCGTVLCTFSVTVQDNQAPAISCPADMTVNTDPGACTAKVCYPSPSASDNCTPATPGGYTFLGAFGNSRYYRSNAPSDFTGQNNSAHAAGGHLAVITSAAENAALTAVYSGGFSYIGGSDAGSEGSWYWQTCEPNTFLNFNPGEPNGSSAENFLEFLAGGKWNDLIGSASRFGILEIEGARFVQTTGLAQNAAFPVGTTTNSFVATDASGNSSACSFSVTVEDNTPPAAGCQDVTIQLNASGEGLTTAAAVNDNSSDACGIQSLELSQTDFDCSHAGENPVTLTVTDNHGNISTCTALVTVEDPVAPEAICQDVTVSLDASGNGSTSPEAVDNGSNDACRLASLELSRTDFDCGDVGPNAVVLTVTDNNGNTATCTATVTVEDNVPPVAVCPDITVELDQIGNGAANALRIDNPSTDACGIQSVEANHLGLNCGNVGIVIIELTVTDNNGNTSTCEATVTVKDTTLPYARCQDVTVELDALGFGTTTAAAVNDHSHDACGIQMVALDQTEFSCSDIGPNTVTLTATDKHGNTSTCTATVTVEDNVAPAVICQDITVELNAEGQGSTTPAAVNIGASEACGIQSMVLSQANFTCSNVGGNMVTLTVTDNHGNVNSCTATITVKDHVAPAALCQNVTVQLNANGQGSTTAAAVNNGSSDACGIQSLALSQTAFNCSTVGGNTVTLTVTDVNGNTSTCTATVSVQDNIAPTAICKNVTVQLNAGGQGSTTAAAVNNGSSDACGIQSLALSQTAFTCANVGGNNITLTVTDVNGNAGTCTATVTVQDNVAPNAICKNVVVQLNAGGQGSTTAAAVNNGSSDACGIPALVLSKTSFNCSNVGGNMVTLTATDVNGNSSTCTANVTVQDNIPPTVNCPANITVDNASGQCSTMVNYSVTGSDNCSYALTKTGGLASGQSFPVGVTANTWKATDPSGNTSSCSFTVTVNKTGDSGLLWAYTVIGFEEVKMKTNTVQSGGVGVVNAGKKAKLEQATLVTAANTFVKAPSMDLNGGSQVSTYIAGPVASGLLPAFQPNSSSCSNDLNIPDNSAPVVINLACYRDMTIGKNVTVTFSGNTTVQVRDLKIKENATVLFAQNTNLLLDKKLDADKSVDISNGGFTVWIYAEDQVKIDDASNVTANIYTQHNLKVEKTSSGGATHMTGLFIADKVDSKDNVFWNWSSDCPFSAPSGNFMVPAGSLTDHLAPATFELFPNPTSGQLNIRLKGIGPTASALSIRDQMGRVVWTGQMEEDFKVIDLDQVRFPAGLYFVTAIGNGQQLTQRLVVTE